MLYHCALGYIEPDGDVVVGLGEDETEAVSMMRSALEGDTPSLITHRILEEPCIETVWKDMFQSEELNREDLIEVLKFFHIVISAGCADYLSCLDEKILEDLIPKDDFARIINFVFVYWDTKNDALIKMFEYNPVMSIVLQEAIGAYFFAGQKLAEEIINLKCQ